MLTTAWGSVAVTDEVSTAFTNLVGRTAVDLQCTPEPLDSPALATRTSTADSVRIRDFEICNLGDVRPSGAPEVDFDSLVARFPITISSLTVSADVEIGHSTPPDSSVSPSRVQIRFAPLRVDVLGKIGVDGISGRAYVIVYGVDIRTMRFSFVELAESCGTDQMARLHQILSDPFIHRAMQSTVGLLARSAVERDHINGEINRSLRDSWPDSPGQRDALDLAAESPEKISLTAVCQIARGSIMPEHFTPIGAPDIDAAPGNWNTRVTQCFAAASMDGQVVRTRVSIGFRVHEGGQITTTVSS